MTSAIQAEASNVGPLYDRNASAKDVAEAAMAKIDLLFNEGRLEEFVNGGYTNDLIVWNSNKPTIHGRAGFIEYMKEEYEAGTRVDSSIVEEASRIGPDHIIAKTVCTYCSPDKYQGLSLFRFDNQDGIASWRIQWDVYYV